MRDIDIVGRLLLSASAIRLYHNGIKTTVAEVVAANLEDLDVIGCVCRLVAGTERTVTFGGGAAPVSTLSLDEHEDGAPTEPCEPCDNCGEPVHPDDFCGNDKPDGTSEYLCVDCYVPACEHCSRPIAYCNKHERWEHINGETCFLDGPACAHLVTHCPHLRTQGLLAPQ